MKKYLFLFVFVFCVVPGRISYARDFVDPIYTAGSKDDKGVYTSGVVYVNTDLDNGFDYRYEVKGEDLYIWLSADGTTGYIKANGAHTIQEDHSSDGIQFEKGSLYSFDGDGTFYRFYYFDKSLISHFKVSSSLPIFREGQYSKEDLDNYLKNGDTSGATNAKELNEKYTDKYDDSIPLPQNLKVVSGVDQTITGTNLEKLGAFNKDIVLTWEQPEIPDGMQFEIEAEFSAKRLADDNYSDYKEYTGEYHTVVQKTAYGETNTVTVSVDHKTMNAMKEKGFLTKVNFRVRNCINNKTSDWVLVTVDIANKTATATQQGYEDNSNTGGDTYNDTNVDASDNNKNVVDSSNINFGSLSNFIKDGFGLIGNGGIITLMSRTFIFLPGTFWTIIYFFVSMLVFVCVIKLIKDVIF